MMIQDAEKNFSQEELKIHDTLRGIDENLLMSYVIKRNFYKEPTQAELDAINDIYAEGVTYIDVDLQGKVSKLRLLNSKDYADIKLLVDKEIGNEKSKAKRVFIDDNALNSAKNEFTMIATLAASVISIGDSLIEAESANLVPTAGSILGAKSYFIELLPYPLVKTLYDKYTEFETRIYDLFQYDSVRKK